MIHIQDDLYDIDAASNYFLKKLKFTLGPMELQELIEHRYPIKLLDVRNPEDYLRGHIKGAVNLPSNEWENFSALDPDSLNIFYSYAEHCHLAAKAAYQFAKNGFRVMELQGGYETWQQLIKNEK